MVKLGVNVSEKKAAGSEEGFDTIPLMTPLDAAQLQIPPPDMVRRHRATDTHFYCYWVSVQLGLTSCSPRYTGITLEGMALLVVCALAFLVCVVFLVVFKVYQYEHRGGVCRRGCTVITPLRVRRAAGVCSPSLITTTSPSTPSPAPSPPGSASPPRSAESPNYTPRPSRTST
ncbi:neuron-specific protein family member 1, partial [Astyanax mexicanus]